MTRPEPGLLSRFAALPLAGLEREYPNYLSHHLEGSADIAAPSQLHPVFFGCYDWHSSVHGHWLLLRCLRWAPELPERTSIEALFERRWTAEALLAERDYFAAPGRGGFERPYGWAWLFALARELELSSLPAAPRWREHLQPLLQWLRARLLAFLPSQRYPIRAGTHANTAFALILLLDYARHSGDRELEHALTARAQDYYAGDHDYPAHYEPGGDDFLSGALCEAVLLGRLLPGADFAAWFADFLPGLTLGETQNLLYPVEIGDRRDPKLGHLDGLHLSRAWCLGELAQQLGVGHPTYSALREGAGRQLAAALPQLASGDYAGDHWLASFALLASETSF